MKNQPGNDMAVGGANLAATFIKYGLVDELWEYIHPIAISGGIPMFPVNEKLDLEFVESLIFPGEVVLLKYQLKN